jgi:hypothetical protein
MYLGASFSLLDFGAAPTVWYFFFILIHVLLFKFEVLQKCAKIVNT